MADSAALLRAFAARTSWNTDTLLGLLCEYIDNQESEDVLNDFLLEKEASEKIRARARAG